MDADKLEALVRQVLLEKLGGEGPRNAESAVRAVAVGGIRRPARDRRDTGRPGDRIYTHDLFSLTESPRLGAGIMEMEDTTFPWTLSYDEMDYVISGRLDILKDGKRTSAGPGELIYIPKGSQIQFSVTGHARFLYFVYPANWQPTFS